MKNKLQTGRATKVRTLGVETTVYYHDTPVVSFNDAFIKLSTGGHWSVTTKRRMNQASSIYALNFSVYQNKGDWFIRFLDKVFPFNESILYLERDNECKVMNLNGNHTIDEIKK